MCVTIHQIMAKNFYKNAGEIYQLIKEKYSDNNGYIPLEEFYDKFKKTNGMIHKTASKWIDEFFKSRVLHYHETDKTIVIVDFNEIPK